MKNDYEVLGDVTKIILNSKKYGRMETFISTSDFERVNALPNAWYASYNKKTDVFYVYIAVYKNGKQKKYSLHRWIMQAADGKTVDHINHNTFDNTRGNLRVCTNAENQRNKRKKSNLTSKYIGVHWSKQNRKFKSSIKINNKTIGLGVYDSEKDAAIAYNEAAVKYHGDFAKINILGD